ncbi:helix-turn-helix domain-containing protein [Priestia megaterium]|uniref:helix-turn-helix domain-containing protein n=2 Tax=Priestia megaterium TaxID=1404 RepID=UPI0011A23697|nr:helix-turn-helix transcriptional regulator [Priestia megaterium]
MKIIANKYDIISMKLIKIVYERIFFMEIPNKEQLTFICENMTETFKLSFFLFNKEKELIFQISPHSSQPSLSPHKIDHIKILINEEVCNDYPLIKPTKFLENFLIINLKHKDNFEGAMVVGPFMYKKYPLGILKEFINSLDTLEETKSLLSYYESIPIVKRVDLIRHGIILYYMIYQKELDLQHMFKLNKMKTENVMEDEDTSLIASEDHNAKHEKLLELIKEGNSEEIDNFIDILDQEFHYAYSSKRYDLKILKSLALSNITLAVTSAIRGGLYSEIAYDLSNIYVKSIESSEDLECIKTLTKEAFIDLGQRVRTSKNNIYSKEITICMNFINDHIYDIIKVSKLSELVNLHPSYLSRLFKKETGILLNTYIQKVKIEESKALITSSSYSISEICSLLHFANQSHFTKVFKELVGITPYKFLKSREL